MLFVSSKDFLGPFRLVRMIRSGANVQIWEARAEGEKESCALKAIKIGQVKNKAEVEALKHEGAVGKTLKHPNVIKIYEYHSEFSQPFLHMELYPAKNLKQLIKDKHEAVKAHIDTIIRQCCESLIHLHSSGWIHCDVKPDNFLVSGKAEVKLIDFSIAKPVKQGFKLFGAKKIQGTRSYMAPEQIRGKKVDARTDVYGLGCMMFEMVAGRPPFSGMNSDQLLQKHLNSPPPTVKSANKRVRNEYSDLVGQMLAKDPEKRPQSIEEVLRQVSKSKALKASAKPKTDKPPE